MFVSRTFVDQSDARWNHKKLQITFAHLHTVKSSCFISHLIGSELWHKHSRNNFTCSRFSRFDCNYLRCIQCSKNLRCTMNPVAVKSKEPWLEKKTIFIWFLLVQRDSWRNGSSKLLGNRNIQPEMTLNNWSHSRVIEGFLLLCQFPAHQISDLHRWQDSYKIRRKNV